MAPPAADLVIVFRGSARTKQGAIDAEAQYTHLMETIKKGGLTAVGRRGTRDGQVLIFIKAPDTLLAQLVQAERYRDFVNGVPSYTLPNVARDYGSDPLSPAERIRFTHTYVVTSPTDDGLGIAPGVAEWSRVESIMALHDRAFNEHWIKSWTSKKLGVGFSDDDLDGIKNQFGEQLALYFAFLSFYTKSLIVPVALGLASFWLSKPFNPYYSASVCVWSVIFVEWWRIKQRSISIRWGSFGSEKVQLRRSQFKGANDSNDEHDDTSFPWWKREGRILASLPVIAVFATALTGLLTTIFVVEAFVTQLYTGPAVRYVSLTPTAMFLLLVPRLVGFYQTYATRLTGWENHVHEVNYEKSLAYKTFAMSSIVAFGGLYLSAFVYVPFGEQILQLVQQTFFTSPTARSSSVTDEKIASIKDAKKVLNPDRLKNQVFAYLITNQVIGEFLEVGVPSLLRFLGWAKERAAETEVGKKGLKKVGFNDEKTDATGAGTVSEQEKRFLDDVRSQVALPAYDVFVGALVNNWVEIRGDAIKIATYGRRPLPRRTDTIGSWMEILTFLTWQGALVNSALVYLFYRGTTDPVKDAEFIAEPLSTSFERTLRAAIFPAALIALSTSHAWLVVRAVVRHILVRAVWRGSQGAVKLAKCEKDVKKGWLRTVGGAAEITASSGVNVKVAEAAAGDLQGVKGTAPGVVGVPAAFWEVDEGLSEVRRGSKAL
ncbi:hypothetical protein FRC04_004914 [Tulasnella sp. 424]|nr:hypothetical protein FRC04_004914 [Tulasnella sp. 424]